MKEIMGYEARFYSSAVFEGDETYYEDFHYSKSYEMENDCYGMGDYRIERMEASITYRLRAIA